MRTIGMRFCSPLLVLVIVASSCLSQDPPLSESSQTPAISLPPINLEPNASGVVPQAQFRELLRYAQDREVENEKRLRDYTYIEGEEEHKLDGSGNVKKTETRTREVLEVYGEQVERLIAKDDKPLPAGEAKKEEEKIQKVIDKYKNESDGSRRKRLEKEDKERQEERKFVLEIADAFTFRLVGSEILEGRDTWVIEGEPRTGYEPKERSTKIVSKFKGRVWIDKAEFQWVKLDITAIDSISVGWFLARIHKGMHIEAEQTKINDEVWLPKHVAVRVNARLALLKSYNEDVDETFRDYKKFRTESKITAIGETK
jgi:hypothetical protein